jgi:hypothetical protein
MNLYIREISNQRVSVGSYVRGKWRNLTAPFSPYDGEASAFVRECAEYRRERTGTPVRMRVYGQKTHLVTQALSGIGLPVED